MNGGRGHVVVVGGGVIGASCAYYLNRTGWQVTVVDKGAFGKGCSHGNCGFVCPSHVLPLAGPGAIRRTLWRLFSKGSPIYVKPRLDFALWRWLWRFARRCNVRDLLETAPAIQALLNSSRLLYDQLMATEPFDCEWQARGMLLVFRTDKAMKHYAPTDRLLRETFHLATKQFDGPALTALEPALKPGLAGGFLFEADAHLRPDKLMSSWRRVLESRGVAIRENCEVQGIHKEANRAVAVQTSQGRLAAEAVVVAAGAWTPFLNRQLGCRIPIQPGKGYSITMPRPAKCPTLPLIFEEHRVAVTPMKSGYRLGSTMEFAGYDAALTRRRLDYLKEAAGHYLHEPVCEPVQEEWFGWRPMTYDGKPVIDKSPALSNVWIAAGHNMLGVATATATGKLMAELMNGERPHVEAGPYAATRF